MGRHPIFAVALAIGFAPPAYGQQATPNAVPVATIIAARKPIAKTLDFVGRVEAINRVDIRARVTGFLEAVLFKEGDVVKEGDPLYRIEKGIFEAAVKQAESALERAKAAKVLTVVQLQRAEELLAKNAGTPAAKDQALAADQQAQAAIRERRLNFKLPKSILGTPTSSRLFREKLGEPASQRVMWLARI